MPPDARTVRTRHGELTLEQIADALPGTADIMESVGVAWWKCAYAARGGNWPLAAYFARRVHDLLGSLAVTRPKYVDDAAAFQAGALGDALRACERADGAAFERAFVAATDRANEMHVKWGKGYLRWTLPDEPPKDLDLRPQPQ